MCHARRIHAEGAPAFEATIAMHFHLLMHGVAQGFVHRLMQANLLARAIRISTLRGHGDRLGLDFGEQQMETHFFFPPCCLSPPVYTSFTNLLTVTLDTPYFHNSLRMLYYAPYSSL